MKTGPTVGLLPLYLKLYDDSNPTARDGFAPFLSRIEEEFTRRGVAIVLGEICRLETEFKSAVSGFERAGVDCIVTVHLAYSPSLESIDALVETDIPIVILDTTMDASFGLDTEPGRIMYNHGIHGVMDLASMLRRRGRAFLLVAGHLDDPQIADRVSLYSRAAFAAGVMRRSKVLRIGASFKGMGDFYVDSSVLRDVLGIRVDQISTAELAREIAMVSEADVERELDLDRAAYECELSDEVHRRSVRAGLGVRRVLEAGEYDAFSANFLEFSSEGDDADTVPFLEASKSMSRGIGYAGEGDVLTAAFVGALARAFPETTFTEIFCPDWTGNSLFLSHMGEVNPLLAAEKPIMLEMPFPYTSALGPAKLACCIRTGPATFTNIVPGPGDSFSLIIAPVEMLGDSRVAEMKKSVRGWMRPELPIDRFLEEYSRLGGTHHSALIAGDRVSELSAFAEFLGLRYDVIRR